MIGFLISSLLSISMVFEQVDETRVRSKEYVKIERYMVVTNVTRDHSVRLAFNITDLHRDRWTTVRFEARWIYSS